MRFGVGMNTDHTLEEVGLQFSVTRELDKLKRKLLGIGFDRSKQLKSFLES